MPKGTNGKWKIVFVFERGGELVAELMPEVAPNTAASILRLLPLRTTVYHTRWCGREIYLPAKSQAGIPRENQTTQTNTGDVTYWREWEKGDGADAISIYYGAEVVRDHRGYLPVNVFARIPQAQWEIIEEVGLRVWQQGTEKVTVDVLKGGA